MPLVRVEFKIRALIEAANLPRALDAASRHLALHRGFSINGNAAITRTTPKWWSGPPVPVDDLEAEAPVLANLIGRIEVVHYPGDRGDGGGYRVEIRLGENRLIDWDGGLYPERKDALARMAEIQAAIDKPSSPD